MMITCIMKSPYKKLNIDIYEDKHDLLDKFQHVCCSRNDCHTYAMSYHEKQRHVIILSLFHKGAHIVNLKYDFKKRLIRYKVNNDLEFCCHTNKAKQFVAAHKNTIKNFFRYEVLPINSAINENAKWNDKKKILKKYMCDDTIGIVKNYVCFERKCKCGKQLTGIYNQCWQCFKKNII